MGGFIEIHENIPDGMAYEKSVGIIIRSTIINVHDIFFIEHDAKSHSALIQLEKGFIKTNESFDEIKTMLEEATR